MKNNQSIGETYRLENGLNNDEHRLFHEYLLISPSYQLAHRVMTGQAVDAAVVDGISKWDLVLGDFPMGLTAQTEELKNKAKSLGLANDVDFVGWIQKEENEQWYSKAKIWVSIPESDATSISLLEAMACGCIPVVSDLPANREWIQSGVNGIVVEDLQSDFISKALKLNHKVAIEINKQRIEKDGTKEANRTKFLQLYQTIVKE